MNLITQTKRREALALGVTGDVVSLLRPISLSQLPDDPTSTSAFVSLRVSSIDAGFLMERQQLAHHGSTLSHLDALCHAFYDGKVYNGVPIEEVFQEGGCTQMGISGLAAGSSPGRCSALRQACPRKPRTACLDAPNCIWFVR